jgi:hypothetical protein
LSDALRPGETPAVVDKMLASLSHFNNAKMVLKLCEKLINHYPTNVRARLLWLRILSRGRATRTQEQRARRELHACRGIIATQDLANKAELLAEVEELHRQYAHPFDSFFGGFDDFN